MTKINETEAWQLHQQHQWNLNNVTNVLNKVQVLMIRNMWLGAVADGNWSLEVFPRKPCSPENNGKKTTTTKTLSTVRMNFLFSDFFYSLVIDADFISQNINNLPPQDSWFNPQLELLFPCVHALWRTSVPSRVYSLMMTCNPSGSTATLTWLKWY